MTAMPPTTGHLQLIRFARQIGSSVKVMINTQPHEPMVNERVLALRDAVKRSGLRNVEVSHYNKTIEQDPKTPGFWDMWQKLMIKFGIKPGDNIVASEPYGQKLAEITGTQFFPYDINRDINCAVATHIRNDPAAHFDEILPEFQRYLTTTVTVFGAESTGKTTLSRQLAEKLGGQWVFEYARPYLENTLNEITPRSMKNIWIGQAALQRHVQNLGGKPYVIQDTDLFSTVGYWQFPHWRNQIGKCPSGLIKDAKRLKSDLYIITASNIPFEPDPLRYGGDVREGSDEYWINVCKHYGLPYIILNNPDPNIRLRQAVREIKKVSKQKAGRISFDRHGL